MELQECHSIMRCLYYRGAPGVRCNNAVGYYHGAPGVPFNNEVLILFMMAYCHGALGVPCNNAVDIIFMVTHSVALRECHAIML